MLPNLSGLNLGCATDAKWGAGVEDYQSLMDEPEYDGNGVQVNRGLRDEQLGKISKALELLQRVVDLPQTETFPKLKEMNASKVYEAEHVLYGFERGIEHDPGRLFETPIEYPDEWRDFEDYMGFASFSRPSGMTDIDGNPWPPNVAARRARALRSWGRVEWARGWDEPPEEEGQNENWGAWDPSEGTWDFDTMSRWKKESMNAFRFPNRQFSKRIRRERILQYVDAAVYNSYATRNRLGFNPHGKSWSSIAEGIKKWIVLGTKWLPGPSIFDGDSGKHFWKTHFKDKDPSPFGTPTLFVYMADVEKSAESYAFAPEEFKEDPDVQFAYAMLGVEDAAKRAMRTLMTYAHLPEEQMYDARPLYRTILHRVLKGAGKDSPVRAPNVAYSEILAGLAKSISEKIPPEDSKEVADMHEQLLHWLQAPSNPLGKRTMEEARGSFEPKRRRMEGTLAFPSMVAFHGKAAVLRWRIAEHVCVV